MCPPPPPHTHTHPTRYLLLQYNILHEAATLQPWWIAHIVVRDLVITLVGAGWWEWLLYSDMSPYKAKVWVPPPQGLIVRTCDWGLGLWGSACA